MKSQKINPIYEEGAKIQVLNL
jgi:hypothetical protein